MSLYASGWLRKLYKRQLRGLRLVYRVPLMTSLSLLLAVLVLTIDMFTAKLIGETSKTIFSEIQYKYMMPICMKILPDLAYLGVVVSFYVISATVVDTTVYDSVEYYVKNYQTHPEKITYMCFNILTQGLLLTIGYFSLFITLIKLATWQAFVWDDAGFILVISNILAGAMKYPKRNAAKWNDLFLNSYAIFCSIKGTIIFAKYLCGNGYN